MREGEKVMRALGNRISSEVVMKGFKNYYNVIRPHQALKGKTLADASGLDLKLGENRWIGLIEKASKVIS